MFEMRFVSTVCHTGGGESLVHWVNLGALWFCLTKIHVGSTQNAMFEKSRCFQLILPFLLRGCNNHPQLVGVFPSCVDHMIGAGSGSRRQISAAFPMYGIGFSTLRLLGLVEYVNIASPTRDN
jgi:hypothetical protein